MNKESQDLLTKLKELPHADPVQIASFIIIVLFIGCVVLMACLACCYSCCNGCYTKRRLAKVYPLTDK
ncbi:hypothetical protein GDO86_013988 [Hymenochirus boettgeri]|uniref:Small integral membrane protein 5 n=1 Tax=Hymenochirus boettgeri TaxID=247094 RepID=A0A8T2JSN0_9PIPI|nr:hypothetical protein GDO86_013988 [Hymenochirus boettgeri]